MILIAPNPDRKAVQDFYHECGYRQGISPCDIVVTATEGQEIIGVVRLAFENNVLVLRGMQVASHRQKQGIGSRMLFSLNSIIRNQACWGISLDYLEKFYGLIGFHFVPDESAPPHLQERIQKYRLHNEAVRNLKHNRIMFRPASS